MRKLTWTLISLTTLAGFASAHEAHSISKHMTSTNLPGLCSQLGLPMDSCHKTLVERAKKQSAPEAPEPEEEPQPEEQKQP